MRLPSKGPLGSPSSVCRGQVFFQQPPLPAHSWLRGRHSSEEGPWGTEFIRSILTYLYLNYKSTTEFSFLDEVGGIICVFWLNVFISLLCICFYL